MSFIGPRSLLTGYVHIYKEFQNRRHGVKPDITGWVQVNGRNAISWDQKFTIDILMSMIFLGLILFFLFF